MLCRFTAFVAVDSRVVNEGGETRRVTQPVELPSGWESPGDVAPAMIKLGSAAPLPPPAMPAPGGPPRMAPARAEGASAPLRDESPVTSSRARMPMTFSAVPAALRAGKAVTPAGAALSLEDVRTIAATEARRLREGTALPVHERRDQLDDLLSRLAVLVTGLTEDEYAPLRELVTLLGGDGSVDEKWAAALRVLTAFGDGDGDGDGEPTPERPSRKAFWKR